MNAWVRCVNCDEVIQLKDDPSCWVMVTRPTAEDIGLDSQPFCRDCRAAGKPHAAWMVKKEEPQ